MENYKPGQIWNWQIFEQTWKAPLPNILYFERVKGYACMIATPSYENLMTISTVDRRKSSKAEIQLFTYCTLKVLQIDRQLDKKNKRNKLFMFFLRID